MFVRSTFTAVFAISFIALSSTVSAGSCNSQHEGLSGAVDNNNTAQSDNGLRKVNRAARKLLRCLKKAEKSEK